MEKFIPLHSLVFFPAGYSSTGPEFPPHENEALEEVHESLFGPTRKIELASVVRGELRRRVGLKLSLGERVVVHGNLDTALRSNLTDLALNQGASVFGLASNTFGMSHLAPVSNIINLQHDTIVLAHPPAETLKDIQNRFRGVTVVGDVHGNLKGLEDASLWAKSRNHLLWLLGDILDYGPDSLPVVSLTHEMVMNGDAALTLGNHERKIARWLQNQEDRNDHKKTIKLSEGNRVTTDALKVLPRHLRDQWVGKFRSLLSRTSLITSLGDVIFTHAAIHPDFWSNKMMQMADHIESFALYGEYENAPSFRLVHRWVDSIPNGKSVFVGHDCRSNIPLAVRGKRGGQALFLDTGSGKKGFLSSADLRFTSSGTLQLENFNRHD